MKKIFILFALVLISCNATKSTTKMKTSLEGSWKLNYIANSKVPFNELYSNVIPFLNFDLKENRFSGSNGCNRLNGQLTIEKNKISFKNSKTAMTMMACPGNVDKIFMETLEKVDSYSISNDGKTLNFIMGDIAIMRFEKSDIE